ncbi:Hypothetical predicted protein [Paramuricea clavata]|uniref:Endonuclease/exonuclease/phosphatase domain-containing protein n=1 Tax=Paramuricea clavata TaxID=317549 RepID=A0A7D9ELI5_PARCT|nr:Hypothetical predicted protein [Paramuricea clavata]
MVVFKRKLEWRRFIGVIMWMFMLFIIFWLAKRSKPELVRFEDRSTSTNISIASELARIPDRLCFLWISTRDNILRKSNYPCKHHYGLELQVKHKNLHLLLCILLAGDVATNPGPTSDSQSRDGFKILYLNARSLKAFVHPPGNTSTKVCKISLFQDLVYSGNYDVVCVCETWLNNSVLSSEIIPNYGTVFRRDRTGRIGGGVLVAIKSGIQVTRRHDLETDNTELIVTELFKPNSKPSLNNSLQRNQESSRIVMIGDFNLPSVKWSSYENVPVNTGGSNENEAFCEMVDDNFLQQFISGPTHIAGNKLDLLLCNSPEIIGDVSAFLPECFPTDHYVVEIDVQLKFKRAKPVKRRVFDYRNGKFDELRNFLTRNPINITPTDDIDNYWEQWKETLRTVKDTNSPPWIDKEVRILIRKKYRALKNYRMNRSATRKRKLRSLTQQTKRLIRRKHQEYLAKIESSFSVNPKLFWSYHKAILRHRANLHHEITFNGVTSKSAKDKATLFNAYFSSVFRSPSTGSKSGICDLLQPLEIEELSNITLNAEEIARNETSAALYADDTKVYKSIKSEDDCQILQHALTSLECWSHDNNLDFNQSKCKVLTITRKKTPLVHVYHMNSKELLRVDKEKDLGVCVSANFNWDVHIHTITNLSYVMLVKSGLHPLSNSSLESKASKEEPPRGYYNPSMAK